jgi:transcriptional regulator with XRE-family HTH domain
MNLVEVGERIRARRVETGLLQGQVAKLTGISRVTINQLENGTLGDLGFAKLKRVLDLLGVCINLAPAVTRSSALVLAARSISISYPDVVSAPELADMLRTGDAPARFHPHLMSLLDETPLPLVIGAVAEASTVEARAKRIMKHLGAWSDAWKSARQVWS